MKILNCFLLVALATIMSSAGCKDKPNDKLEKIKTSGNFHMEKLPKNVIINGRIYSATSEQKIDSSLINKKALSGFLINDAYYTAPTPTTPARPIDSIKQPSCMGNGICIMYSAANAPWWSIPATLTYGRMCISCNVVFGMSSSVNTPVTGMVQEPTPLILTFDKSVYLTGEAGPDPFTGDTYAFDGSYNFANPDGIMLTDPEGILAPLGLPHGAMIMKGIEGAGRLQVNGTLVTDIIPIFRPRD